MTTPQVNATLTLIRAPGQTEDYDQPATEGEVKWQGEDGVYLTERVERQQAGDISSVIVSRALITSADMPVEQGDTITFTPVGGDSESVVVRAVARRFLPGVPSTTRIQLEDG